MDILAKHIVPTFLEQDKIKDSAVWNQQISFNHGEKVQIVAGSGRGKTSLVHFLYGLRNDYSGEILIDNKEIRSFSIAELSGYRREKVSIIFQDLRLFGDHSAYNNIEIKRVLNPFHSSPRINEMAEKLGIATKLNQLSSKCSYGEQQRIAIIRALQQPFDLLIMDEPFSNLDEINRQKAMKLIDEEVKERNATVILLDLKELTFFAPDQILYL